MKLPWNGGLLVLLGTCLPLLGGISLAEEMFLEGGATFEEPLKDGRRIDVKVRIPGLNVTSLVVRDGAGRRVELRLKPVEVKSGLGGPSQQAGIDGKILDSKAEEPPPEVLLDGCVRVEVVSIDNGPHPKDSTKVWFPAQPFYVRPAPGHYAGEERANLVRRWNDLPGLASRGIAVRIERAGDEVLIWIDDRFVARVPVSGATRLEGTVPGGARWDLGERESIRCADAAFLPVSLRGYENEAEDPEVEVEIFPGKDSLVRALFPEAAPGRALNVGRARWIQDRNIPLGVKEEFSPSYFARRAFDRTPENLILSVPNTDYRSVRLLCAPVPGGKPVVTLRLTHFADLLGGLNGVGDALVDRTIYLEKRDGRWPEGCGEVGKIRLKDGTEAPLLLVEIPLNTGGIPDLVDAEGVRGRRSTQYLDLEITKELQLVQPPNRALHAWLPLGNPSSVHLLGVTLEQAPRVRLEPRQTGNVYLPGENPGWKFSISGLKSGFGGILKWTRRNGDGTSVSESRPVTVPSGTSQVTLPLDFDLENGWHGFQFHLLDKDGRIVWERETSLVQLAEDNRRAGFESPFATWWFRAVHGGTGDLQTVGPLYRKLGMRHVNPFGGPDPDSAALGAHGLRLNMLPKLGFASEKGRKQSADYIAKHPDVKWAMIFHEDRFGDYRFPPEFVGRKVPPLTGEQRQEWEKKLQSARTAGDYYRKHHPDIRLITGNGAFAFAMSLMQHGFPKDLVDAWGDETTGQSILPETQPSATMNTLFWLREYSKKFGYNAPVTTCYEWAYRTTKPGDLTPLEQAQFYCRDALLCLAYGAPHINTGLLYDVSNAYYYSRWGASGLMSRYPLLDPKPSFAAISVLTRELDRAVFERNVPADSPTTHGIEFRRDKEWIYAFWIPRGERSVYLHFDGETPAVRHTDMMGRESTLPLQDGAVRVELSGSPVYIHSADRLASLRSGPTRLPKPPEGTRVVDSMDDDSGWTVSPGSRPDFENFQFDFVRKQGNFVLSSAHDPEKGEVTRLTLTPDPGLPWPVIRYTTLKPASPLPIGENPAGIGVWVRGNSSWGRVFFEIEDARGTKLLSAGKPEDGWSLNDWKGEHLVNFDGWNFLNVRLPGWFEGGYPMPQNSDWNTDSEPLTPPLKLTAIIVEMRERIVRINEVIDVPALHLDLAGLSVVPNKLQPPNESTP